MFEDNLPLSMVIHATLEGETIESYIKDLPFPSALIYGDDKEGEPIHSVWAYDESKQIAILITAYKPDPDKWIDFRVRR